MEIPVITWTEEVTGIELPWTNRRGESGTVRIPMSTLETLCYQDRTDSHFGSPLLLLHREGLALEQAGLAEKETKGGYHRTQALIDLCSRWEGVYI